MFRRQNCPHNRTRCLHGDEINARTKVYIWRFWKPDVVRRQACLECDAALDRTAICSATGRDIHTWTGPWTFDALVAYDQHQR